MESTSHLSSNLASLSATLTSISNLHSQTNVTDSQSNLQPFTCAILNSYNLDITEFIRDAEQLEQNLFWVPPRPGTTTNNKDDNNKHQSQSQTAAAVDEELELGANILMPRNPERRQPVPPTPLRLANRSKADGRNGNVAERYGAKTLLLAAQKLVDNYIPTPRARKHIKQLLRRQTELQSSFSKLDRHASILEETISRGGRAPSDFNSNTNNGGGGDNNDKPSSAGSSQESQRLKRLREELQKEEMEVMALEEMEKELQREIRKNKALASAGSSSASSGGGARTSSTSVKKSTAEGSSARPSVGSRPSVGTRPSPSASSSRPSGSSSSPSNTVKRVSSGSTTTTARRSVSGSTSTNTPPAKARTSAKSQDTTPKKKVSQPVKASSISKDTSSSPQTKETEEVIGDTTTVPEPKNEEKEVKESEVQEEEEREEEPTVRLAPSQVEDEQEGEGTEENLLEEELPEEVNKVEETVDQYASPYTLPIPKPTDELERISELIWNTFPDLLRSSSLPNSSSKEIADFKETLLMIDSLANPPPSSSNNGGDISMSEDGTVITTSSTSSTTSTSNFGPPASHTPTNTIFCLILSSLLRSPEPHQVEFPFLKQLSQLWWDREGKEIFVKAYPPNVREEDVNLDESGTAMATRAVYSMAGKKLAFPKRTRDGSHKVLFGTGLQ